MSGKQFPDGFLWGTATAAAQIEGAWNVGGKSPSIWDTFCREDGRISDASNIDVACDHYNRYLNDVALIEKLGTGSYRLSLSWPRILPDGTGRVNREGIEFYRNLLGALKKAGIKPAVTLYHWDLPQVLLDKGGWTNRDCAEWFAEYARVCYENLDDLVYSWITLNEPAVVAELGYLWGSHAPGLQDPKKAYQVAFNIMLGHGRAVQEYRKFGGKNRIGLTTNVQDYLPASDSAADREAVELAYDYSFGLYGDAAFIGGYSQRLEKSLKARGYYPEMKSGDFDIIRQDIDFFGINYYMGFYVSATGSGADAHYKSEFSQERDKTLMGWDIVPEGLHRLLVRARDRFPGVPIQITENGAAYPDQISGEVKDFIARQGKAPVASTIEQAREEANKIWNGPRVSDKDRIAYVHSHLNAIRAAIEDGVPVEAYYLWSLMDNFEWSFGYTRPFGIYYVDFESQTRVPKESAAWYSEVVRRNAL